MYTLFYCDNRYNEIDDPLRKVFNNRKHLINWLKKYCKAFKFHGEYITINNSHVVILEIIYK
jgi:hypothetical protein